MKKNILFFTLFISISAFSAFKLKPREYYLTHVYHCTTKVQLDKIDAYLKNIYLPHIHQLGISNVGVFEPINNDTNIDKTIMVWIPLTNLNQLDLLDQQKEEIDPLKQNSLLSLVSENGVLPYNRIETTLSKSFKYQPQFQQTTSFQKSPENIFEFRSYESADESMFLKKVHMFNEGKEIKLFHTLNFNALFYSKVIIGSSMPNLIYITRFSNLEEREARWRRFKDDPDWKQMSNLSVYLNTVSKSDIVLMRAKPYSDL